MTTYLAEECHSLSYNDTDTMHAFHTTNWNLVKRYSAESGGLIAVVIKIE